MDWIFPIIYGFYALVLDCGFAFVVRTDTNRYRSLELFLYKASGAFIVYSFKLLSSGFCCSFDEWDQFEFIQC